MTLPSHRIFVSHSHLDNDFGTRLAQDLRLALKEEHAVFYDVLGGVYGGDTWWDKLVEELTARDVFLLVLSPDAMNSPWVRREINIALNKNKLILPILHRPCTIRADLETIQIISFLTPKPYEAAFQEVLIALDHPKGASSVPSKTKEWWVEKGNTLYGLRRYKEALAAYEQAIRLDPNYARAHGNKGHTLDILRRYEEALAAYEQAIRLDPNDTRAYNAKGNVLDSLKRYKKSLVAYEQAIYLNPNDAHAHGNKGYALDSLKRYEEAHTAYDEFIRLNSGLRIDAFERGFIFSVYDPGILLSSNDTLASGDKVGIYQRLVKIQGLLERYLNTWHLSTMTRGEAQAKGAATCRREGCRGKASAKCNF